MNDSAWKYSLLATHVLPVNGRIPLKAEIRRTKKPSMTAVGTDGSNEIRLWISDISCNIIDHREREPAKLE